MPTEEERKSAEEALRLQYEGRLVRIMWEGEDTPSVVGIVEDARVRATTSFRSGILREELRISSAAEGYADWWYINISGYRAEVHPGVNRD